MKRFITFGIVFLMTFFFTQNTFAQFKNQSERPDISTALTGMPSSFLGGFLNPEKFRMHHTVSMSFGSFAGQSLMLSSYVNSMEYQFSKNLWLQANLGIMSSPYNTFGKNFFLNKPQFFGSAQLNYRINDKAHLMLRFESSPFGYGYSNGLGYDHYNRPLFQPSPFDQ